MILQCKQVLYVGRYRVMTTRCSTISPDHRDDCICVFDFLRTRVRAPRGGSGARQSDCAGRSAQSDQDFSTWSDDSNAASLILVLGMWFCPTLIVIGLGNVVVVDCVMDLIMSSEEYAHLSRRSIICVYII